MNSAISEACNVKSKESDRTGESANHMSLQTFNTVAAIFNICLKGLAHLCRDIPGRRCRGHVIFSLVKFFVNALVHLHNTCLRRTVYQAPNISNHQDKDSHKADYEDTIQNAHSDQRAHEISCQYLNMPRASEGPSFTHRSARGDVLSFIRRSWRTCFPGHFR